MVQVPTSGTVNVMVVNRDVEDIVERKPNQPRDWRRRAPVLPIREPLFHLMDPGVSSSSKPVPTSPWSLRAYCVWGASISRGQSAMVTLQGLLNRELRYSDVRFWKLA